ncbi:MAG TPA: RidA family protein [Stellaceae bacterium]|nr:RidA family protein [Stellaceae bacterium]
MSSTTLRQKSIEVANIGHSAPIPTGSRVGPVLATSAIGGRDPKTGKLAPDADGQARNAFEGLKLILAEGGMGLGDVVKLDVFLVDDAHRETINKYWLECYPDPHRRPARHTVVLPLRGGVLLQISALAVALS